MKLDISRQTLQKIIIGVVVLIIVIFVIMRIWRSSRYAWPNASETSSITITGAAAAAASGNTPALLTFTTQGNHSFSVGDLVSITGVNGVTYTDPVTGASLPLNASAGGATPPAFAVYIYSIPTQGTFTVKGTQAAGTPSVSTPITTTKTGTASFTASQAVIITQTSGGATATGTATVSTVSNGSITALSAITAGTGTLTAGTGTVTPSSGGTNPSQVVTITVSTPTISVSSGAVVSVNQAANYKVSNTDLMTCQTDYATDLITSPSVMSTTTSQTLNAANKTLNITSSAGFSPNDKVIIPGVVDGNNKSVVLVVESVGTNSLTFTAGSIQLITSGAATPGTGTVLPSTAVSNITAAYNKRDQCVLQTTSDYTIGHCKYLPQSDGKPVVPLPTTDPVASTAYQEYQRNIQAIQTAYVPAMTRLQQNASFPVGTFSSGFTLTAADKQKIVEAARKADLANATQKYLATACPGFYALTSGGTVTDPSGDYKNWAIDTGSTAPTATASSKKFWAPSSGITDAAIMTWAQNAGLVTLSGPVSSVRITGSGLGAGYISPPTVNFSAPPTGGTPPTGATATLTGGKITGVTFTNGGSGYTTAPTISFTGGGATTVPSAADISTATTIQIAPVLTASGPLVPVPGTGGPFTFTPTGSAAITYTANKYSLIGTGVAGKDENWRIAYKNGPGTYPVPAYNAS